MRIAILGPLEVMADDGPVTVAGTRLRALLIRLALDPGRTVSVGALGEAVWPDRPPKRPEHALQELVSRLRRALPADAVIRSGDGGYRLEISGLAVDTHHFEELVRGGLLSLRRDDPARAIHQLREGLALWRGPALADLAELPFAAAAATRYEELRITAAESAIAAELAARPDDSLLIAELEDLIAASPFRERLRLLHIRALHDAHRTAEALTAFDRYRTHLATELGTDPGRELLDLHLHILRGETPLQRAEPGSTAATPAPPPDSRVRLRSPLTSFVGRERERAEVGARLERARLVTLVGPGGAGKTRLAVAIAGEVSGRFPGGVGVAELAAVDDVSDVPQAVAAGLGVVMSRTHEPLGIDPVGLLAEALPTAPTLLVLDNCEHLIAGVASFTQDLLGRVPGLRILATSRQSLGITGETLWETTPLPVPPPAASNVADYPAVRLFLDRALAIRADLPMSEADLETIAVICRHLDGLPLALELAAAKLRVMPAATLRARLGDRFAVLAGGSRTALPRHRALRAVLDWDWELLTEHERAGLARLGVFSAPFDQPAAEALGVPADELEALLDKSLLQLLEDATVDPADPGSPAPRYRMLESIREYGLEKLTDRGELDVIRAAHATWFLDLAERALPQLRGRDQLPWLRRLDADRDNFLAALRFSYESGDADTAARLGSALGMYWALHGAHADAVRLLRPVLGLPTDHPHPPLAAAFALHSMLAAQATELTAATEDIYRWTGADRPRPSTTLETHSEQDDFTGAFDAPVSGAVHTIPRERAGHPPASDIALAATDATGDEATDSGNNVRQEDGSLDRNVVGGTGAAGPAGDGAAELAWALVELADERTGAGLEVVGSWLEHGDAWTRGMFWLVRSFLHANASGVAEMDGDLRTAAACFEAAGERWGFSTALTFLAFARATLGDFDGATEAMAAALTAVEELGDGVALRVWLVMVRLHSGAVETARAELGALLAGPLSAGDTVMVRLLAADIARFDADAAESARCLRIAADELNRGLGDDRSYRTMFGLRMGLLRAGEGRVAAAAAHCADAWANAVAIRDTPMVAEVSVGVARTCLAAGLATEAARVLGAGHALRGAPDARYPDIVSLRTELDAAIGAGAAVAAYEQGRALSRTEAIAAIETCLSAVRENAPRPGV
ncbi:BTAD domain-containing putative transcriptional regulator [Nocardia terrae]|uniref:BTAD domain-containing putative transcriptional regulator n=1 Tax=Nocardia terrae TaxID=2675851 RepID=UPI0018DFCF28|nr:BTAD domain-containing putative transcriptional regulator [Nocardia terrae]